MFFSRVSLRPDHQRLRHLYQRDVYTEHQVLMSLFPADTSADLRLLFRRDEHNRAVVYYLVSQLQPATDHPVLQVACKPYQPQLNTGDQLQFSLRANAVITRKGSQGKSRRHDVVMDYKKSPQYQQLSESEKPAQAQIAQLAGWQWLHNRMHEKGFTADKQQVLVEAYNTHQAYQQNAQRHIHYSTLDFSGRLQITDAQRFIKTLYEGLGPAKAFGCGLMLVRRLNS